MNNYKCNDFDIWYERFERGTETAGWKFVNMIIQLLTMVLLFNTMMSGIVIFFASLYKNWAKKKENVQKKEQTGEPLESMNGRCLDADASQDIQSNMGYSGEPRELKNIIAV